MMNTLFDLQLFAGDSAAEIPEAGNEREAGAEQEAPEEKKAEPKYTDADIDRIIGQKFAEWQKKQQKAVDEAKKLAEMNATQKAEYERDQLQKELDEYKRRVSLSEMTRAARQMLSQTGITIPDDLLSVLVTTDAAQTKDAVEGFVKAFTEAVEQAVKRRLQGEPPRRGTGSGVAAMTKEQIMSIRDPELRQQKMLEHKDLFHF